MTPHPHGARLLMRALAARGWTLGTAESLTAGLVTAAVAAWPGASRVLRGGVVAYDVEVKVALLDVPREVVARHGVVSEPVAIAMARGAARHLGSDVGVATTGVAGPGPSGAVAAGTVCLAVHHPVGTASRTWRLAGTREQIRHASARLAIALALGAVAVDDGEQTRPGGRCTR